MKKHLITIFCMIGSCMLFSLSTRAAVKVGDVAPNFTLKDESGIERSLSEFVGKKVALYFYPMDETPGCTKQACSLRSGYQKLLDANIVILGISFDSVKSHKKFKEKNRLPFPLLSDSSKNVAKKYGAVSTWFFFFYSPMASRMTFLINESGKIVAILKNVNVNDHAQDIIKAFEKCS